MKDIYQVIKTVRLSEKATLLGEQKNQYVFVVDRDATKIEIRQAVEKLFGKKVLGVSTMQMSGKYRRRGNSPAGRSKHWKKAIVRLKEGDKIELA
ncbi:MAG: 50S ribosomal protein L23 [Verrucomicrobiaceae bacterium]